MKEPNYKEALFKGWQLAWHHKSLWVFGLFAAFLGQMGIFEYLAQAVVGANRLQTPSAFVFISQMFKKFNFADFVGLFHTTPSRIIWLIWLIIIILGAVLLLTYVSVVSQATIVHNTAKSLGGLHTKLVDVDQSWHESHRHFWSLFGLNFVRKFFTILFVSFIVWGMWNASIEPSAGDMFLFLILFLLATLVGMVLYLWLIYAVGYVVVEQKKFVEAMRLAWRLFTRHWLVSLEIGFIFIILNIFLALLILAGVFVLFLPSLFLWTLLALSGNTLFYLLGLLIGFVLFSLYLMLLGSVFVVFSTSTWTFLFMKMHKHGLKSSLISLFHS